MPTSPTSQSVLDKALAQLPAAGANDDEVLPPTQEDFRPQQEPEYVYDDEPEEKPDDRVESPGKSIAAPKAPAGQPAAPKDGGQPAAPEAQVDPWAEVEDVEYTDSDTGDKYVVRAPKTYADKVKNGYARRSIMDRNSGYLSKHKEWLMPVIENKQLDTIAPFIQRAIQDSDFANYVADAYRRRMAGLPLDYQQQQALAQAAPAAAPQQAPAQAPAAFDPDKMLAATLDGFGNDVDDYSKELFQKALGPVFQTLARQQQFIDGQTQRTQQTEAQRQTQRAQYEADLDLGRRGRDLVMQTFPDRWNAQTPAEQWQRVAKYAEDAGLFKMYGKSPATLLLAVQAYESPSGLAGIGRPQAGSVAAATVGEIRRQGERLGAAAAQATGHQVATGGPGGAAPTGEAKRPTPPRFKKDSRTGAKIPLTAREKGEWLAKHPEAM